MSDSTQQPTKSQDVFLSDKSEKDKSWDEKRSQCQSTEAIYGKEREFARLAERMRDCALQLDFKEEVNRDTGVLRFKLKTAKFCKVRHCMVCAWRRSMKNKAKFLKKLPELMAAHPTARFLFLTLTVQNCPTTELRSTLAAMSKAWKRMTLRKDWPAIGWIRTTEVTKEEQTDFKTKQRRGRRGYAHPHFHVMVMVKASYFSGTSYLSQARWLALWQEAMRDPGIRSVDIRVIKDKTGGRDLSDAVAEVLKYSVKPGDLLEDTEFLYEATRQLHKLRFLASGGILKDLLKEEMSDKEMVDGDEEADGDESGRGFSAFYKRKIRKYVVG